MRTRLFGAIALASLVLAACGGDDDGGDGGGGGVQDQVADMMIAGFDDGSDAESAGVSIDEDCIRDVTDQLSDEDAQAILDAGEDGDAVVSAEAEALGPSILECIDLGDIDFGELDTDTDTDG